MQIDVLILNYNGAEIISECIEGVLKQQDILINMLVYDNGSTDQSRAVISKYHIPLIGRSVNGSFTSAYNEMFCHSKSDYVLLLSNDVVFKDELDLYRLLSEMENEEAAAIAPLSRRRDGTYDQILKPAMNFAELLKSYFSFKIPVDSSSNHVVLQDSCLLFKRSYIKEKVFNESLRFYFTEDNLCDKLRTKGRLLLSNTVEVNHAFMFSTKKRKKTWQVKVYYFDYIRYSLIKYGLGLATIIVILTLPLFLIRYLRCI